METVKLKVASGSDPKSVAGAIANNIREKKQIEIIAMGPAAVNQTMKSIAIAREYLSDEKVDVLCRPEFMHIELDGEQKSAIKFTILTMPLR
ncbi:MAG TPA: stage V sporulation protein S [Candidatus Goldiibacteriota bacterium]|nr:stage V sporulation protein S [Candidatus Goldiibacteriota bacterium]